MYRLIVYIIMKCKNKWIWNMFKWTFYFYFHLLPLDKWDLCKTGTLNVHSWAIKVIVNRRFWINYIMMEKKKKKANVEFAFLVILSMWLSQLKLVWIFSPRYLAESVWFNTWSWMVYSLWIGDFLFVYRLNRNHTTK